ncbi:MAG: hypothetical protein BVN35_14480 [Proteobacteria bacterium ST_bin11]|nr:MAG: hypothetical protein BVN35_14480 [Proteobacteria bacterium ST_bin11]
MVCNVAVQSLTDGFGFIEWLFLNMFICSTCLYSVWNRQWFRSVTRFNIIPITQTVFFGLMTILAMCNGLAAFMLWHCNNWDEKFVPLLLNVLMVVFINGFPLVFMLTKEPSATLLWSMAAVGLSGAFIGTSWKYDVRAAGIGFIDLTFALIFFVFAYSTWMKKVKITRLHASVVVKTNASYKPVQRDGENSGDESDDMYTGPLDTSSTGSAIDSLLMQQGN